MMYEFGPQIHPNEGEKATNCFGIQGVNSDRFSYDF